MAVQTKKKVQRLYVIFTNQVGQHLRNCIDIQNTCNICRYILVFVFKTPCEMIRRVKIKTTIHSVHSSYYVCYFVYFKKKFKKSLSKVSTFFF